MNQLINKILFASKITAGLPSFVSLLWHSKKLRWSKTGFIKAKPTSRPVCIKINQQDTERELFLRTFDGDIDIFFEIFWKKIYELPQLDPANIKTIIDLGANIGLSALYFLNSYPNANLFCVEPEHSNFELLSQNLLLEINSGKAKAIELAVMGQDGNVSFTSASAKYNSKVLANGGEKKTKAVSMTTLLKLFAIDHIDLLKVDVEGAEKYIFSADTEWLNKVDNVIIEVHSIEDREICMKAFSHYHFTVMPVNVDPANENLFWARKI